MAQFRNLGGQLGVEYSEFQSVGLVESFKFFHYTLCVQHLQITAKNDSRKQYHKTGVYQLDARVPIPTLTLSNNSIRMSPNGKDSHLYVTFRCWGSSLRRQGYIKYEASLLWKLSRSNAVTELATDFRKTSGRRDYSSILPKTPSSSSSLLPWDMERSS